MLNLEKSILNVDIQIFCWALKQKGSYVIKHR